MKIEMKKGMVPSFYLLAQNVKAKGRKARALVKFGKLVAIKVQELQDEEKALNAEYYEVDETGNGKRDEKGELIALEGADTEVYSTEWTALHEEKVIIDLTEYQPYMEHLLAGLNDWDEPINGMDALVYDELLDILESAD